MGSRRRGPGHAVCGPAALLMGWPMKTQIAPRIVVDPTVRFGKPVIEGTRVPVAPIMGKLAGGMSAADVAAEYGIAVDDVQAALAYAAQVLAGEELRVTA